MSILDRLGLTREAVASAVQRFAPDYESDAPVTNAERCHDYYQANRKRVLAQQRKYYAKNKAKRNAACRK